MPLAASHIAVEGAIYDSETEQQEWQRYEDILADGLRRDHACRLAQFSRAAWYRRSRAKDQSALRMRIRDLAHARPRFGSLRIWVL